jgi:hypothetical protein
LVIYFIYKFNLGTSVNDDGPYRSVNLGPPANITQNSNESTTKLDVSDERTNKKKGQYQELNEEHN